MDYAHFISHVPHGGSIKDDRFQLVYDIHLLPILEQLWKERKTEFKSKTLTIPLEILPHQFEVFVLGKLYPICTTTEPAKAIKEFLTFHYTEYCSKNKDFGDFKLFLKERIKFYDYLKKSDPAAFEFRYDKKICDEIILDWINSAPVVNPVIELKEKKPKKEVNKWAFYYYYLDATKLYKGVEDGILYETLEKCPGGRFEEMKRISVKHGFSFDNFKNHFVPKARITNRTGEDVTRHLHNALVEFEKDSHQNKLAIEALKFDLEASIKQANRK